MRGLGAGRDGGSNMRGWILVAGIALLFLCWGLAVFFIVGDKGPPPWHYGVVEDVPGQSPYAVERDLGAPPAVQHVAD